MKKIIWLMPVVCMLIGLCTACAAPEPVDTTIAATTSEGTTLQTTTEETTTAATTTTTTVATTIETTTVTTTTETTVETEPSKPSAISPVLYDALGLVSWAPEEVAIERLGELEELKIKFEPPLATDDRSEFYSLRGLEYCTNLKTLSLWSYIGEDLEFLKAVPQLETLSITSGGGWNGAGVYDLTPLESLTKLKRLEFDGYSLPDLTSIGKLTTLEELWLHRGNITDVTPIGSLENLRILSFGHYSGYGGNDITDISPLANLKNLKVFRITYFTGSLAPIKNLPLQALSVSMCTIEDYGDLPRSVESLLIDLNPEDFHYLENCPNLDYYGIQYIEDPAALDFLNLKGLWIRGHQPDYSEFGGGFEYIMKDDMLD